MSFDEWLDKFVLFLKGFYCGLPLEKRCRKASEIIPEAIRSFTFSCNETDWIEKKEET